MAKVRLHLDADTAMRSLEKALHERGHDVTRTPTGWMPFDATDEMQLLGASTQGRCIFTFNIRDFIALSQKYPEHHGIILAQQHDWRLTDLIGALDRLLNEADPIDLRGMVRWLNDWRG